MVNFGSNRRTEREVNFFFRHGILSQCLIVIFILLKTYPEMGAKGNFSIVLYTF